jgi:hypothetical protein
MVGASMTDKFTIYGVPKAVMDHLEPEIAEHFNLRPLELIPVQPMVDNVPALPILFSKKVYWPWLNTDIELDATLTAARRTGKSLRTEEFVNEWIKGPEQVPAPFWTNRFFYQGYYPETKPREFAWKPELTVIGRKKHYLYRTYVHPIDYWKKGAKQFAVPARRRAGVGAYKLKTLQMLRAPEPADWSQEVLRAETQPRYFRHRDGMSIDLNDYPPGQTVAFRFQPGIPAGQVFTLTRTDDVRFVNPYQERASERRAKYSSTMDGNGKPRKK